MGPPDDLGAEPYTRPILKSLLPASILLQFDILEFCVIFVSIAPMYWLIVKNVLLLCVGVIHHAES